MIELELSDEVDATVWLSETMKVLPQVQYEDFCQNLLVNRTGGLVVTLTNLRS